MIINIKRLHIILLILFSQVKALANEDTMLPTLMFPRLPARATFVADTNFLSGTEKTFLILFRNILCPQQMFPSLRSMETQHSFCVLRVCAPNKHHEQQCVCNNVSSFASTLKPVIVGKNVGKMSLKALANEDTLLRTHCCRHKCFPVCPRAQHLLRTQHFVSATNVSQFAQPKNHQ